MSKIARLSVAFSRGGGRGKEEERGLPSLQFYRRIQAKREVPTIAASSDLWWMGLSIPETSAPSHPRLSRRPDIVSQRGCESSGDVLVSLFTIVRSP